MALLQFTCRNSVALFRLWLAVGASGASFSGGKLLVPSVNVSIMQCHTFLVVAPIWNSLPLEIRLLPTSNMPLFYKLLKSNLFLLWLDWERFHIGFLRGNYLNL